MCFATMCTVVEIQESLKNDVKLEINLERCPKPDLEISLQCIFSRLFDGYVENA